MSEPSSSTGANAATVTAPARPSGGYGASLHVDTPARNFGSYGGSGSVGGIRSPWIATGELGSPLDDNRSIASSTRSTRRRRGAPESAAAADEGKVWAQTFSDLERMQQENKERMHGSVRSGRSSPSDVPFFRAASTSSFRNSVRRRRWHAASGANGMDGAAAGSGGGGEEGPLVTVTDTSPQPSAAHAPRLIATDVMEASAVATTAAEPGSAAGVGSPSEPLSFASTVVEDPARQASTRSYLSGLPKWLKSRSTETPQKTTAQPTTEQELAHSCGGANEETEIAAGEAELASQNHDTQHIEEKDHDQTPVSNSEDIAKKAGSVSSNVSSTPPSLKERATGPQVQQGGSFRSSPLSGAACDTTTTTKATASSTSAALRGHQGISATSSPLMQTYLARHTRTAAMAQAAPSASTPSKAQDYSVALVDATTAGSSEADVAELAAPAPNVGVSPVSLGVIEAADEEDSARRSAPPQATPPPSIVQKEDERPRVKDASVAAADRAQLPAALAVDNDDERESEMTDGIGGQSTMRTSNAAFAPMTITTESTALAATTGAHTNSDHTSTSPVRSTKAKQPARVAQLDVSVNKPVVAHPIPHSPSRSATLADENAVPTSVANSASRERLSASSSREGPAPSAPRPFRQRKSISVLYPDAVEQPQQHPTAPEKTHGTSSGHLHRSTALFELRRQQVLLDRQERELRAAAEERARVGATTHTAIAKKKTFAATTGLPESRGAAAVLAATAPTPAKEKSVKPVVEQEDRQTVRPARRPLSAAASSSAASATSAATKTAMTTPLAVNGRPRFAMVSSTSERRPVGTASVAGAANASTTMVVSPPPTAASTSTRTATSAPHYTTAGHSMDSTHPSTTPASSSSAVAGQTRKPAALRTSPSPTRASGAAPTTTTSSVGLNTVDTRAGTSAADTAETAGPTTRADTPALSPVVTRAQLHSAGGSSRKEMAAPGVGISSGGDVRPVKRRLSTKLTTPITLRTPYSGALNYDKPAKPASHEAAIVKPSTVNPVRREKNSSVPVVASEALPVVEAATAETPAAPQPASEEHRPAPFCVECGQRHVDDSAKFCAACGHKRVFL
ncbi:hypothetical protein ABB37_01442 [Leptomonas pyrrhocoris]|uniref:Zinc-ribbon domain-containing protein n=1 Tax=Leptomonas pyrrhocoris TaxID=157538 RepID=A0A0N0DZ88_LEPPY|nr:hypothetical protein ABB37_01442 [Leptomonas pyrrhocoris]KPA85015.1 hypothetical protein ABB37_01442 [Leptomonas pyrrhocoris]|eukprot:XP_015663454.1 hypothetical protein ABB37_01442 [Leptomonas pyrrhocoris]